MKCTSSLWWMHFANYFVINKKRCERKSISAAKLHWMHLANGENLNENLAIQGKNVLNSKVIYPSEISRHEIHLNSLVWDLFLSEGALCVKWSSIIDPFRMQFCFNICGLSGFKCSNSRCIALCVCDVPVLKINNFKGKFLMWVWCWWILFLVLSLNFHSRKRVCNVIMFLLEKIWTSKSNAIFSLLTSSGRDWCMCDFSNVKSKCLTIGLICRIWMQQQQKKQFK